MGRPKKVIEPTVPEVKPEKKDKVKLVSYAIKMVIPLERYANIQPEIIVKGGTLEEAHAYCSGHLNKLWKEYYMITERRETPEPVKPPVAPEIIAQQPPASSVALSKATQAIQSCLSLEALDLIAVQVEKSVKLTNEDKNALGPILATKFEELSNKNV